MYAPRWIAFSLALLASPSFALIFGSDDRVYLSVDHQLYQSIGLVRSSRGLGTGFLVDNCNILTSRHMLSESQNVLGKSLQFLPSKSGNTAVNARVVAAGRSQLSNNRVGLDRTQDWLLAKLDTCVGASLGFVVLGGTPVNPGERMLSAGYPIDRSRKSGLSIDPSCTVRYVTKIGLLNDCAFLQGNSGGPIFNLITQGNEVRLDAIGIGSAGYQSREISEFDSRSANVATALSPIMSDLRPLLHPTFIGSANSETFIGSGLLDHIDGRGGADIFILDRWGGDRVKGGAGPDRFVINSSTGKDHLIEDFNPQEGDVVDVTSIDADGTSFGIQSFETSNSSNKVQSGRAEIDCDEHARVTRVNLFVRKLGTNNKTPDFTLFLSGCFKENSFIKGVRTNVYVSRARPYSAPVPAAG